MIYSGGALADAVNACFALNAGERAIGSLYLIAGRRGASYSQDGFRAIWQRAMRKFTTPEIDEAGRVIREGGPRFTEHDLRAKVASDSESLEAASKRLGHQQQSTTKRSYIRRPVTVQVLDRA